MCTLPRGNALRGRIPGARQVAPFKKFGVHMKEWKHNETAIVDHVIEAFYLIRRSVFMQLGGFDERFFVYLEDSDLSLRAYQAGWSCLYVAEAKIFHAGGGVRGK